MNREGFCRGCESCITPCKLNQVGKSLDQMIDEFLAENPDMWDELYELEKKDDK